MDMTPDLEPVKYFHEADEYELQLKSLTMDIVREHIRSEERDLNVYGTPHLGSFDLIERWVKTDGLAMNRGSSQDAMRYLFGAWRARNPKRGLHFLRTYLQLLWPQAWEVDQLWQKKSEPYPQALFTKSQLLLLGITDPSTNYFLTSRVNVDVAADTVNSDGVLQVLKSVRSVCGAKFCINIRLLRRGQITLNLACVFTSAQQVFSYGSLKPFEISSLETSFEFAGGLTSAQTIYSFGGLSTSGVATSNATNSIGNFGGAN